MTRKTALKLALACMEDRRHKLAFDANLYRALGESAPPYSKRAAEERDRLKEAMDVLTRSEDGQPPLPGMATDE